MKTITLFLFLAIFLQSAAQTEPFSLDNYNKDRVDKTKKSMYVLGGWAVANIAWGAAGVATASGSDKKFHEMNLAWGAVNGILAGSSLLRFKKTKTAGFSLAESIKQQHSMEKLFLLNAGLDFAYLGAGAWMLEKSKTNTSKPEQWKGYGNSLLLQGGFLLLFDGINYAVHSHHGKGLYQQLEKVQLTAGVNGIGLAIGL
jgi:hypothetical protein